MVQACTSASGGIRVFNALLHIHNSLSVITVTNVFMSHQSEHHCSEYLCVELEKSLISRFCKHLDWHAAKAMTSHRNRTVWKKRPLSQVLINYAVEDVSRLLNLADELTAELGKSQLQLLARLSLNYSRLFWLPADRELSWGYPDSPDPAGLIMLGTTLTQSNPRSWLAPLFLISKKDDAAYTAESDVLNLGGNQGHEERSHDAAEGFDIGVQEARLE